MTTLERLRRVFAIGVPTAISVGLLWGVWTWWEHRRDQRAISEIRADIQANRPGHAIQKLTKLSTRTRIADEVAFLLGTCEKSRGKAREASAAWSTVSPSSPFAARALQGRMDLELERGRLAEAERIIEQAMNDPNVDASGPALFLGLVYCQQGRLEEAEQLIETSWARLNALGQGHHERAIRLLRLHIRLRLEPISIEMIRAFLDSVGRLAPEDDRIWLAKANLAIQSGIPDQAQAWLDACLRKRPADVPVWQARLNWAIATKQLDLIRQAEENLKSSNQSPTQQHRITADVAALRGDTEVERESLERLIAVNPADLTALKRLENLATLAGRLDRAAQLRDQAAEISRLQSRYRALYERNQPFRDAVEMAHLAEQLGQRFEAIAFLTIAAAHDPNRYDLQYDLK